MAEYSFWAKLLAGRWVPGPNVDDGIRYAKHLGELNILPILNYLGESYTDKSDMKKAFDVYMEILSKLKDTVKYQISLKPTQLGLPNMYDVAAEFYDKIVLEAKKYGVFVWLDIEEFTTVDDTIKLYERNIDKGNTGICIQSYLKRSRGDIERLTEKGGKVRLVKGAYKESETIAYRDREDTNNNFREIMRYLFENASYLMIASHDMKLVEEAEELYKKHKTQYSVAFLNGIRNREALELSKNGTPMAIYIPFGEAWMSYATRRLREISNLKLFLRSLLHGQKI